METDIRRRVIVALDLPDADAALRLADALGEDVAFYKVGLELYTAGGDRALDGLRARGREVFLDLKLHDIPNTVAAAAREIARKGAAMTTLHTAGGFKMMRAAREAVDAAGGGPRLLGVTVLTSIDEETLRGELHVTSSIPRLVRALAGTAREAGMDGVVASALELSLLREHFGEEFLIVTPGIRPAGTDAGDQKRVVTPAEAFRRGASFIVVGRPVTAAADPLGAVRRIFDEIAVI